MFVACFLHARVTNVISRVQFTCETNRGVLVIQRWALIRQFFWGVVVLCICKFISRLREGIKLKIPPELLHKKGMKSREQSQALLEEVHSECHEANVWLLDDFRAQLSQKNGGTWRNNVCVFLHRPLFYDFIVFHCPVRHSILINFWIWLLLFQ